MRERVRATRGQHVAEPTDAPRRSAPHPLLTEQRLAGNVAVRAKLRVGAVDDPAERDADRLADQVVRTLGGAASAPERAAAPTPASAAPGHGPAGGAMDDRVADRVQARLGSGAPMEDGTRQRMESAFGADFGGVRIHQDSAADELNRDLNARAFTAGNDVFLGAGERDERVLAHELAHVVQSGGAPVHRFPATALASPVNWKQSTGSVFRPGEGVSGGVYILSSKDPKAEIPKVVVKPVFGETGEGTKEQGEQLSFGDKALAMLGIKTPASRVVRGGEMNELLSLCAPYQPAPPDDPQLAEAWKPLSEAESFVVMSEVPQAKSLGSMAEKAATDPKMLGTLLMTLFDDNFMFEFGRMCVGDMLVGNMDRLNEKKTNLGNVMVSIANGKVSPWAIDTTASLGEPMEPSEIAKEGGTSLSGFTSAKASFQLGPAGLLKLVSNNMEYRLEGDGKPPPGDGPAPAEVFKAEWAKKLPQITASFTRGWNAGLAAVTELVNTKEGRAQMKGMTKQFEGTPGGDELRYQSLKTNALYLAGRAEEGTHEEAGAQAGGYAAFKKLQTFDPNDYAIPVDKFHFDQAPLPPSAAYTADWEQPPSLPGAKAMNVKGPGRLTYNEAKLDTLGTYIDNVKYEMSRLGEKGKGSNKKPRNRVMAAEFVANSYLVGGGAWRAVASAGVARELVDDMELVGTGGLKPSQISATLPAAKFAKAYVPLLATALEEYKKALQKSAEAVPKIKKFQGSGAVAAQLTAAVKEIDWALQSVVGPLQAKDPNAIYNRLATAARR